jgi:hypothetical protein
VGPVAWNVSSREAGGSIFDVARSVATLVVVTILPVSTPPHMRTRRIILLSGASSRARIGIGTTEQTNTRKDLVSHPHSIIPWTNQCLVQPERFLPTGRSFWSDNHDGVRQSLLGQVTCDEWVQVMSPLLPRWRDICDNGPGQSERVVMAWSTALPHGRSDPYL